MFVSNCMASYVRLHVAIQLIQYAEAGGQMVCFGTRHAAIIVQMHDVSLYIEQRNKQIKNTFARKS